MPVIRSEILAGNPFSHNCRAQDKRFGKQRINPVYIGKSLVCFTDAGTNPDSAYLKGMKLDWDNIKKFFLTHVKQVEFDLEAASKEKI